MEILLKSEIEVIKRCKSKSELLHPLHTFMCVKQLSKGSLYTSITLLNSGPASIVRIGFPKIRELRIDVVYSRVETASSAFFTTFDKLASKKDRVRQSNSNKDPVTFTYKGFIGPHLLLSGKAQLDLVEIRYHCSDQTIANRLLTGFL